MAHTLPNSFGIPHRKSIMAHNGRLCWMCERLPRAPNLLLVHRDRGGPLGTLSHTLGTLLTHCRLPCGPMRTSAAMSGTAQCAGARRERTVRTVRKVCRERTVRTVRTVRKVYRERECTGGLEAALSSRRCVRAASRPLSPNSVCGFPLPMCRLCVPRADSHPVLSSVSWEGASYRIRHIMVSNPYD